MSIFGLVFYPVDITVSGFPRFFSRSRQAGLGEDAVPADLYPWSYSGLGGRSFERLKAKKCFVPPILSELILDRDPGAVEAWKSEVLKGSPFDTLITGHYASPVPCKPAEFGAAVDEFLRGESEFEGGDLRLLREAQGALAKVGVVAESKVRKKSRGEEAGGWRGRYKRMT